MKPLLEILDLSNEPNIIDDIMKKETRGGKREGSGRPKQKETVVVSVRVLKEWKAPVKKVIEKEINRLKSI